ncbi:MAG: autotransporter assembly complex protein TamA [Alphaproteobacteria bacterium]
MIEKRQVHRINGDPEIRPYRAVRRRPGPSERRGQGLPALGLCLLAALILSAPAQAALDVEVRVTGVEDDDLKDKLKTASELTGKDKPELENAAALRHAAENDLSRLEAALRSEGYYTPEVGYEVTGSGDDYVLTYQVTPGQKFKVTNYVLNYGDEIDNGRPKTLKEAGVETAGSPRGEDIAKLQREFLNYLHNHGFPAARIADRRVEAVPATGNATLELTVDSGPRAVYGDVVWSGLERTDEAYVEEFIPWEQGEQFKSKELTEFRDTLARAALFTSVEVEPGETGPGGVTPVKVQVTERPPRTIGAGASYSTNLGAGGRVFWEHRNLFGSAEKIRLEVNATQVKQIAGVSFRKPRPPERGAWFARLEGAHEDSDAFSGVNVTGRVGLLRKIGKRWQVSGAGEVEWSDFEDTFGQRTSWLGALPVGAIYNSTEDVLDPRKGLRVAAEITPAQGFTDDDPFHFTKFRLEGSGYIPFDEKAYYVAALWTRFGATVGAPIEDIPANRRFYSGGAGSVRGYGYQLLSPLDAEGDPIGGRSVLEGGVEFRIKFTKSIGMVTFIEAGSASLAGLPEVDDLRAGAGIGFRYYTAIGPVRLDVAIPLEKRDIDDDFQFYISLGQAF